MTDTLPVEWAEVVQEYQQRGVAVDVERIKDILWGRVSDGPMDEPHGDVAMPPAPDQDSILERLLELRRTGDPECIKKNIEELERIKAYHEGLRGPGNDQWDANGEIAGCYDRQIASQRFLLQTAERCLSVLDRHGFQYDAKRKVLKSQSKTGRPSLWINTVITQLYQELALPYIEAFQTLDQNTQQIRSHIRKFLSPYFSPELNGDKRIQKAIDTQLHSKKRN